MRGDDVGGDVEAAKGADLEEVVDRAGVLIDCAVVLVAVVVVVGY